MRSQTSKLSKQQRRILEALSIGVDGGWTINRLVRELIAGDWGMMWKWNQQQLDEYNARHRSMMASVSRSVAELETRGLVYRHGDQRGRVYQRSDAKDAYMTMMIARGYKTEKVPNILVY